MVHKTSTDWSSCEISKTLKQLSVLTHLASQIYADISLNQLMAYHAQSGHTLACWTCLWHKN